MQNNDCCKKKQNIRFCEIFIQQVEINEKQPRLNWKFFSYISGNTHINKAKDFSPYFPQEKIKKVQFPSWCYLHVFWDVHFWKMQMMFLLFQFWSAFSLCTFATNYYSTPSLSKHTSTTLAKNWFQCHWRKHIATLELLTLFCMNFFNQDIHSVSLFRGCMNDLSCHLRLHSRRFPHWQDFQMKR